MSEIKKSGSAAVTPILEIRGLQKSFGELSVLKDISLSVDPGNVLSIIGPSGSGKSTLLRCASFLETANGGDILYDGKYAFKDGEYAGKAELNQFRTLFGMVFQNFNLFPHYSVMKNICEPPVLRGQDKEKVRARAEELLKKMGLEKYMKHKPTEMSGGQQQRVGIARALVVKPKIIFADEPTGNLDTKTTIEVLHILQDVVHNEGNTLVMVTHDKHLASYADRRVHILDGEIVLED